MTSSKISKNGRCWKAVTCFYKPCLIFLGIILPKDPLDYDSIWSCDLCHFTLRPNQVEVIEEMIEKLIEKEPSPSLNRVDFYETQLVQIQKTLHETHYMVMKVKSNLISQYGNVPGYFYPQMSNELVSNKLAQPVV